MIGIRGSDDDPVGSTLGPFGMIVIHTYSSPDSESVPGLELVIFNPEVHRDIQPHNLRLP